MECDLNVSPANHILNAMTISGVRWTLEGQSVVRGLERQWGVFRREAVRNG